MPAGLIEHQDGVGVLRQGLGEVGQKPVHGGGGHPRRTSAKSSPVAGHTAAKMEADAKRLLAIPAGAGP
jgi:hypothetical protein